MVGEHEAFRARGEAEVAAQGNDDEFLRQSSTWLQRAMEHRYSYHFEWLGRPIIQFPQDIVAVQELVSRVKPDLIIETGIAHGGSLIFSASLLELNAVCGGPQDAHVVGIDVDIREHNRVAIEEHPLARRITMVEGSSIDPAVIHSVRAMTKGCQNVLVCLDSDHSHQHVLAELEAYAPLVTVGSYCVVFDTIIEDLSGDYLELTGRGWRPGNSPGSAIADFLLKEPRFVVDESVSQRLMITVARGGYLKRVE